jgi:hypothetical protein
MENEFTWIIKYYLSGKREPGQTILFKKTIRFQNILSCFTVSQLWEFPAQYNF